MKKWYEELFENYAERYEEESFTKGTLGEVDFIEKEIGYSKKVRILDIGCGTGRHAVELASRGYRVTGVDLSESMLKKAREKAASRQVQVDFRQADARQLNFNKEFDLVIMLCEGAFPLLETDEMNYQVLKNARDALKEPGKLIFTTLNGLFPLFHSIKDFNNENSEGSPVIENNFDLMTFRDYNTYQVVDDSGNTKTLQCDERYYVPSEVTWLLKTLGLREISIYGCQLGAFSRDNPLSTGDYEMLVIAEL